MPFAATIITLVPEAWPGVLGASLVGTALKDGLWSLETVALRDFGQGRHKVVDDTPAGGGSGMVIRPDIAAAAIDSVAQDGRPLIYLTPRGAPLTQDRVRALAAGPGAVIFCGRFEGLDQRVIEARQMEEICIGDVVLAGGDVAAQLLLEACIRLLPGVLGNADSPVEESFENGLLEHPLYTRPREFEGMAIPEVLLSGDHGKIARWKEERARADTAERRPDLLP
ncbi:MAG: tRNA (guanosine(37)-N1)-methyltransferase TrmD [Hyphomonadaceae bacterium]|jgi:tRNA (guanine37-N1)-methyltransferase|nr:tRNA (guanosine(37)-N1)-methyltransferase TrmD [Hyphomonadaceae bacterium]